MTSAPRELEPDRQRIFWDNLALAGLLSTLAAPILGGAVLVGLSDVDGSLKVLLGLCGLVVGGGLVATIAYVLNDQAMRRPRPAAQGHAATADEYSRLAVWAFVLVFFTAVPGIVLGHLALRDIKRTGRRGHGLATAALIIGYLFVGLLIGAAILAVALA